MASVQIDSELMTNYISASPMPAGSQHAAVLDQNRQPMVFGLSNDHTNPRLRLLRRDNNGQSLLVDLHRLLGIAEGTQIQSFHVEQSWTLRLYLVLATRNDGDSSLLHVIRPFLPDQLSENAEPLGSIKGPSKIGTVQRILMSPISGSLPDVKYPDIFVVHRELDQSVSWGTDITHVHVDKGFSKWDATQEFSTPENASQILDISPAVNHYGQGMHVLYVTQGETKLYGRFIRPDPRSTQGSMFTFVTDVKCPKGARAISSFLNDRGYSSLLIAASDGIHYLNTTESTSKGSPGKLIFTASMFMGIRKMYVTQDKSDITIYYRNAQDELGYTRTNSQDLVKMAVSSMLLPAGLSTAFAPLVTAPDAKTGNQVRQMVLSNDRSGNLTLLEQSQDIGLWRKTPFFVPSPSTPTPLESYTVTIKASDDQKQPLSNGSIFLSASSTLSVILNGRNTLLSQVPEWYDCDTSGSLDFIVPTTSLGAQTLRLEKMRSREGQTLSFVRVEFEPSQKPMARMAEKLQNVKTVEEFKALKTSSGESLLDEDVKKDEDTLKGAFETLVKSTEVYTKQVDPDASVSSMSNVEPSSQRTETVGTASTGDFLMDSFNWIKEKADEVTEWLIEAAGTAWKLVVKIAGELKEFVLDCIEKICEAVTWIWEKIKIGIQALIDFVGFLFAWDDILDTKNTISATITAGLGYAGVKVDSLIAKSDAFFDNMSRTVEELGDSVVTSKQISSSDGDRDSKSKEARSSTTVSWAEERLKNGGAGTQSKADLKGQKSSDPATNFWSETVVPEIENFFVELSQMGSEIVSAFRKTGTVSANELLRAAKPLLRRSIQAVKAISRGLLSLVKKLLSKISDIGNAEINIPIFSWLYKKISGHPLTLFDAISLVIAIPTTIFAKIITGKCPPKFDNMSSDLIQKLEEDGDVSDDVKTDWAVFTAEVAVGVTITTGIISTIKLLYKFAKGDMEGILEEISDGPDSFFDLFGIVVDIIGCFMSIPESASMPGASYRYAISAISAFRGCYHIVAFFIKNRGIVDKVVLGLDLITVLANLGLSIKVGIEEHKQGGSWDDYDEEATDTGFVSAGMNAVAGIAYFCAFAMKTKQPHVSAIGAIVMTGTVAGTAVLEGIIFKQKYDDMKKPLLPSPPAF